MRGNKKRAPQTYVIFFKEKFGEKKIEIYLDKEIKNALHESCHLQGTYTHGSIDHLTNLIGDSSLGSSTILRRKKRDERKKRDNRKKRAKMLTFAFLDI